MIRVWHKTMSPKFVNEHLNVYKGEWMPQMDRSWESEDGYSVLSRKIRTAWGAVEHVTIQKMGSFSSDGSKEVPWSVKQEIKDDLFGTKCTAIEIFPERRKLVDVCDVYHLWVLPPDFKIPFGIHPVRDVMCPPIERGYDCDINECQRWIDSPKRQEMIGDIDLIGDLDALTKVYTLRE